MVSASNQDDHGFHGDPSHPMPLTFAVKVVESHNGIGPLVKGITCAVLRSPIAKPKDRPRMRRAQGDVFMSEAEEGSVGIGMTPFGSFGCPEKKDPTRWFRKEKAALYKGGFPKGVKDQAYPTFCTFAVMRKVVSLGSVLAITVTVLVCAFSCLPGLYSTSISPVPPGGMGALG